MHTTSILHVVAAMDPKHGGVCQAVRTMISGLTPLGVYNEVVSLDDPDASSLWNDSFLVHALGPGKSSWNYAFKLTPWLLENHSRFDAVIIHGLWLYHAYAVRKVVKICRTQPRTTSKNNHHPSTIRYFVMPHGMLDPYFQHASGRQLKAIRNWIYWKLIERHVVNEADGVFFTCEQERRLARDPFHPYHPKREVMIGLGVEDPPRYTLAMKEAFLKKCPALQGRSYLLFLSRIHEKKGVDMLIRAYTTLANRRTKALVESSPSHSSSCSNIEEPPINDLPLLVIAGPGTDSSYGKRMQRMIADNSDIQASVFFAGMLTGDAKWGAFYGCEAFVLPSHQENFGMAVVEALACSKPVLISNQVNIWKEIEAAGGGMIADDTLEGTTGLLERWERLSNEDKLAMGKRARHSFEKSFAIDPAASRLLEAIDS